MTRVMCNALDYSFVGQQRVLALWRVEGKLPWSLTQPAPPCAGAFVALPQAMVCCGGGGVASGFPGPVFWFTGLSGGAPVGLQ